MWLLGDLMGKYSNRYPNKDGVLIGKHSLTLNSHLFCLILITLSLRIVLFSWNDWKDIREKKKETKLLNKFTLFLIKLSVKLDENVIKQKMKNLFHWENM